MSFFKEFNPYQVQQVLPRKLVQGMQCYAVNENGHKPSERTTDEPQPLKRRTRYTGSVKWYDQDKFWGFLIMDGIDVFVHGRDLNECGIERLIKRQKVSFEIKKQGRKIRAVNIKIE